MKSILHTKSLEHFSHSSSMNTFRKLNNNENIFNNTNYNNYSENKAIIILVINIPSGTVCLQYGFIILIVSNQKYFNIIKILIFRSKNYKMPVIKFN